MTLIASARSTPSLLRQDVLIDGRFHVVTDEPEQLGGTDQGPTPHELLVAALAACTATAVSSYIRTKQWDVGGMRVDVEYEQKAEPREFRLKINLEKPITDAQRERLDKVAASCAVRRALLAGFEIRECIVADGVGDCG
ncbi:MAG: OsmC family protein [Thermoleophilia bacterium]